MAERIIDGISDVIVVTDDYLVIRWVSASSTARLGYLTHEMVGRPVADFLHPADLDAALRAIDNADEGH